MTESPSNSRLRLHRTVLPLVWTGLLACVALLLPLYLTHAEVSEGQVADVPAALLLVVALLVASVVSSTASGRRLLEIAVQPRPLLLVSVAAFLILAVGAFLVFGTTPGTIDEQAHLFQARSFAQFKVFATYQPGLIDWMIPSNFQNGLILIGSDGRAISAYWPGWALLMTPFVWLGAPWLLGPAMASLGLYVTGRLTSLLAGARATSIAIILAAASGAFIVTGMSLFPSGGYMTLNLLFAWLLLRGGRRDTLLAGLAGGLALNLNNPVPHALFALPWLLWLLVDSGRRRRLGWLAIGYAPWLCVSLAWFLATSSLDLTTGAPGNFWQDRLPQLVNVPSIDVIGLRFWELVRLWVWSAPGLLVLAALGWRLQQRWSGAWLLGVAFGLTVVLYVFFPAGQLVGWGARYYQSAWGALPILAAILLVRPGNETLYRVALTGALAGLILVVPLQIADAYGAAQGWKAGDRSLQTLTSSGANLYFIVYDPGPEVPALPLEDDTALTGRLVFVSHGSSADQALVDRYFTGARLVIRTSLGSGYARP